MTRFLFTHLGRVTSFLWERVMIALNSFMHRFRFSELRHIALVQMIFSTQFRIKNVLLLCSVLLCWLPVAGQTTVQIGTGTEVSANTLYGPVYRWSSTSSTRQFRSNILYEASELSAVGIVPGSDIHSISFYKPGTGGTNTAPFDYQVYMGNTSTTAPLVTGTAWSSIMSSHSLVYSNANQQVPTTPGWFTITLQTPFTYTGGSLEIAFEGEFIGPSPYTAGEIDWQYTDGFDDYIIGVTGSTSKPANLTGTVGAYLERPNIQITFVSIAGNCANSFSNFEIDSISGSGFKVDWTPGTGNSSFYLEYGTTGFTPGTGTKVTGTYPSSPQPPVVITGLSPQSTYDIYFGEICNSGADSIYLQVPQTVTTTKPCSTPASFGDSAVMANSVDLFWDEIGGIAYNVIYGPSGFNPNTSGTTVPAGSSPFTLTGLSGYTDYDVYLYGDCGTNGVSDTAGPLSFSTPCGPIMAPYFNDFENDALDVPPGCWAEYVTGTSALVEVENFTGAEAPYDGSQALYLFSGSSSTTPGGDTLIAVTPQFPDLPVGDKQIRFHANSESPLSQLIIGTIPTLGPSATFTSIDTITFNRADTYKEIILPLTTVNGYNGTDEYIVFMHSLGATSEYIRIDDLHYETIPACPKVSNISLTAIGVSSASFTFSGSGTSYDVEFGPTGFTQGTGCTGTFSSNTITIDNTTDPSCATQLGGNITYDIYIQTNCTSSSNGVSIWEGPFTFTTLCAPYTAPYYSGFETDPLNVLPGCWGDYVTDFSAFVEVDDFTGAAAPYAGDQALYLNSGSSSTTPGDDTLYAYSPTFSDLTAGDKRVRFWANSDASSDRLIVGTAPDRLSGIINPIDTIEFPTADTYQRVIVEFTTANGYNGTDEYIVLMHDLGVTTDYIRIDEFHYEQIPTCQGPFNADLGAWAITPTTAEVFWGSTSQGSKTYVEVGPTGFTPGTGSHLILDSVAGNVDTLLATGFSPLSTYDFYVQDSCLPGGLSIWAGPYTFTTACPAMTTPHTESFDSTSIPDCWTTYSSTNEEWTFGSNTYAPSTDNTGNGGEYATVDDSESPSTPDATLASPFFDVSSLTNPELEFYIASEDASVTLRVDIWDGSTWTNGVYTHAAATTNTWDRVAINLIPYAGSGEIAIRFVVNEDNGTFQNDIAIDDVSIQSGPACPNPGMLTAFNIVDTSAILNWVAAAAANSNEVWFGPQGFYQGTQTTSGGTMVVVNNDSLTIDTLTGNTCYEFLVRGFCGTSDTSDWVGPFTFCTPCSPFSAPYYEGFDAVSTPDITDCWTIIESSNSSIATVTSTDHGTPIPSAPNAVEFNIGSGNDPVLLVSPQLASLSTGLYQIEAEIAFEGFGNSYDDTIYVGTMASPLDTASFVHYDTVLLENSNGSFMQFRFYMDNTSLIGTNSYVAFKYGNSGGNWEYYIDNFAYELIPTCPDPYALGASNIGTTTTEVYWTGAGSGNWEIEFGAQGFTLGSGNTATSTNDTTTLTGLTSATVHEFYVREDCGSGSYSSWAGPFAFLTNCAPADKMLGTYTIDNSQPTAGTNYNSFADATAALNHCGVRGHVTFNVAAGTYNESLILTEIAGVAVDSTITFNGTTASNTILTYASANDTPTVYLNGADYITLRNMTIENTSTSDGWGVMLQDSADFNTIDSCIINMPVTTTTDIIGIVASNSLSFETSTGENANNLTVSNSTIIGGETGIHLEGSSTEPYNYGNMIVNNTFLYQDDHGIEVDGQEGLVIKGNTIDSLQNSLADGIYLVNINDFEVSENKVISPDYGIYINDGNDGFSPASNSIVVNNMVLSTSDYGIYLNDFENVSVFHNTFMGEPAMLINDQDTVDIRNNIFVSLADYAFESTDALTTSDVIDYNLYYSTNTDAFDIGVSTYTDLAAWKTADATRNQNSVEGDPVFASTTDLHVVGPLANDVGDNTVGISTDIDGDTRPASGSSSVDIGADEYTPLVNDLSTLEILDPKNNSCGDSSNTVSVIIQNIGLQPQTGFDVIAEISGAVTATLNGTYTGTLNSLATDTVILSSFNGVLGGIINIEVYTDLGTDQDNTNDTISTTGINLNDGLAPVPTAAFDTVCGVGAFDTLYFPTGSTDNFYWMTANNDTIGSSDSLVVGPLSTNDTTFYIQAAGNIPYSVGPVDNTIGSGGNFANAGSYQVYFTAHTTVVIDSLAVYPNGAGNVVVNLKDQNGTILQTTTAAVSGAGKTMIPVGFTVTAGSYEIDGGGSTTGGLYRNTAGASYPYSLPGVLDITGNAFDPDYYYFFYDWRITAKGCSKPQGSITIYNDSIAVNPSFTATPGAATSTDLTVVFDASASTGATNYNWDFGDGNTGTGVNPTHTYTANGSYTVKLVATSPCGIDSTTQTIVIEGISLEENLLSNALEVYPNPTNSKISIEVNTEVSSSLTIKLMDAAGRVVETKEFSNYSGILKTDMDLSEMAKGIYILQLSTDKISTSKRVIRN